MPKANFLSELSFDDLNQRYRDTYIHYKDRTQWCSGFDMDNGKVIINVQNVTGDKEALGKPDLTGVFDYNALQIERPRSQYYKYNGNVYYLFYTTNRQYARGLCDKNTTAWFPNIAKLPIFGLCAMGAYNSPQIQKVRFTCKNLFALKEDQDLASPYISFVREQDESFSFFYRLEWLGSIKEGSSVFNLAKSIYKTEINEVLVDAKVEQYFDPIPTRYQLYNKFNKKPPLRNQRAIDLGAFRPQHVEPVPQPADFNRPMDALAHYIRKHSVRGRTGVVEIDEEKNIVRFQNNLAATIDQLNTVRWFVQDLNHAHVQIHPNDYHIYGIIPVPNDLDLNQVQFDLRVAEGIPRPRVGAVQRRPV